MRPTDPSHPRIAVITLAALSLCLAAGGATAAEPPPEMTPEQIAEMQRIYREQAMPGPEHEMLARMAGSWEQQIRMWPEPGAEPMTMTGTAEAELILGGRFLVSESRVAGSEDLASMMLLGFDRRSGEYTSMGMDHSGTYWVTASGKPEGDKVVMSGEDYNPSLDHTQVWDFILRWLDDDTFVWEIVFKDEVHTRGGDPFKMVEITYRRKG